MGFSKYSELLLKAIKTIENSCSMKNKLNEKGKVFSTVLSI